ncbi:MAG: amidohydrolase family protein [Peristeroidobacter soli]
MTPVDFELPARACDTHTHVYARRFPMVPERVYTPEFVEAEELTAFHRRLGFERVVVVHPNTHGTDNSVSLHAMSVYGPGARGVALIDERTSEDEIERMSEAGMRGARINLRMKHGDESDTAGGRAQLQALAVRVHRYGWHVQMFTSLAVIAAIRDLVLSSPVPVVFDHFGGLEASLGLDQPGFAELVELLESGQAYVKISAAYRSSTQAPDYPDIAPYARALIAANPDRILWGSDWPHPTGATPPGQLATEVTPMKKIDDGALLNQLAVWAPDPALRKRILVDNPARLYGF